MVSKPIVKLPNDLIEASRRYAATVVSDYAAGRNAASRAVSSHGAESNAALQAHGRMSECAVCLCFGLDPMKALDWSRRCDAGWDLIAQGARWDVKATVHGRYLIWPLNKRHIFASKPFDALVLVRGEAPTFVIAGFTVKPMFAHEHQIAPMGHCLDEGTWFMHEDELWSMGRA